MGGLIGVLAQETGRYSMFASSLSEMRLPDGWEVKWRFGHNIAQSMNALVEDMYERDLDALWILGDDHAWSPNLLEKLLAHDVEIVAPLCLMRNAPYRPVIWNQAGDNAVAINLEDHPEGGLIQVDYAGSAGMLIKREVFDFTGQPWYEAGRGQTIKVGEDINFCEKAREAGFSIHCDLNAMLGHCSTTVVWPVREEDGWTYAFSMMGGFHITMPPAASWAYADKVGT